MNKNANGTKESREQLAERAERLVENDSNFLDELVSLRKQNGLTQEVVGARMGIGPLAVAAFESEDSNPTLSLIRHYAFAIGVRIEYSVLNDLAMVPGLKEEVH